MWHIGTTAPRKLYHGERVICINTSGHSTRPKIVSGICAVIKHRSSVLTDKRLRKRHEQKHS